MLCTPDLDDQPMGKPLDVNSVTAIQYQELCDTEIGHGPFASRALNIKNS
jgi:hypothetical protein